MTYRPQFAYAPAPQGFRDEPFEYFFDEQTVPALVASLTPFSALKNVPLTIEPDADFYTRGIQIGVESNIVSLGVLLQDALGNSLSRDYVPMQEYGGFLPATLAGGEPSALEPQLIIPKGGTIQISIINLSPTLTITVNPFPITLRGVKRFANQSCPIPSVGAQLE